MAKKLRRIAVGIMLCAGIAFLHFGQAAAMSLTGNSLDVRQAIISAARLGHFNVVLDDAITGKISINLQDVSPIDVMYAVAAIGNLTVEERLPNMFLVAPAKNDTLRRVRSFSLKYVNPDRALSVVGEALGITEKKIAISAEITENDKAKKNKADTKTDNSKAAVTDASSTTGGKPRATFDSATNTLIVYGTPTETAAVENILRQIDVPTRQVSLEAKVVALDKTAAKELGVEWNWSSLPQYPKRETDYETHTQTIENADGTRRTITYETPHTTVTRSYGDGSIPGIIQFGKGPEGYPFEFYYEAKLNALITGGKAKMISRPNIVTLNGQEAIINIGDNIPVPKTIATSTTATSSIEYKNVGIILRCTPHINEDGFITSNVHTEVSSPVYVPEMRAYRIQSRAADTSVRLKDGETMVIGGLIGSEEARSFAKVPFLGDIPLLGALFKNIKRSKSAAEIMIFLTAKTAEGGRQNGDNGSDSR